MKRLLLGLTLLAIIFIAVLCKPVDNTNQEVLLQSETIGTIASQNTK